ncbi:hypothetical protein [Sorangium sp. So ce131]|uniref:hypothetical protein n=1 Tax=Sorangium sp. So ce131 TaxID=3133282 RepID=UPI003F5E06C1
MSRKTRGGMPVTDSTFFCESISGSGAVIVSPSSGIASFAVAVADWSRALGLHDPLASASGRFLSTTRTTLPA